MILVILTLWAVVLLSTTCESTRLFCSVSAPTIVASSSSNDICHVAHGRGSLSYTCTDNGILQVLTWSSSLWSGSFSVNILSSKVTVPPLNINGVTVIENHNKNIKCLSSTLTFSGNLSALTQLNGATINCRDRGKRQDSISIDVPKLSVPGPPKLMDISSSLTCAPDITGNTVTLHWTPPTDTGGQGVVIEYYLVSVHVAAPSRYTCPRDQCKVTTTSTTLTGLHCNTSYTVAVKAVNCAGISQKLSNAVKIFFNPTTCTASTVTSTITTSMSCSAADVQSSSILSSNLIRTSTVTYTSTFIPTDTVLPQQALVLPLSLGVGIPVTFLLTAIISSLLTLLITYQCMTRRRPIQAVHVREVLYDSDDEPLLNETRPHAPIATGRNLAYGNFGSYDVVRQ